MFIKCLHCFSWSEFAAPNRNLPVANPESGPRNVLIPDVFFVCSIIDSCMGSDNFSRVSETLRDRNIVRLAAASLASANGGGIAYASVIVVVDAQRVNSRQDLV
jgi:hypothetical protein